MMSERTWGRKSHNPGVDGLRTVRMPFFSFFFGDSVYGQGEFTGDDIRMPHIFKGKL